MKLIFLTLAALFAGSSDAAKFVRVPAHLVDPFDDGQDHDVDTDPDYYEEEDDDEELHLVEDHSAEMTDEGEEDDAEEDEFAHETADEPMDLAEAKEGAEEENEENEGDAGEDDLEASLIQEETDDDSLHEDQDVDPDASETTEMPSSFLQESEEADHDDDAAEATESSESLDSESADAKDASLIQESEADHDDDAAEATESSESLDSESATVGKADHDDDAAEATESSESLDSESADASLIQESEEADHDDDAAEATESSESLDSESADVDADAAESREQPTSFIQESEEADSEDADDADEVEDEDEEVDEQTAKLNEEYSWQDSEQKASLLQEGEGLQNIPPERQYLGDLSNSKAHPYVYKSRAAATAACQSMGYRGLCSKSQVKGWSKCAYGWMADYKGYWFRKTKRHCGKGKGFRKAGKKVKKMGAYCCNLAMNSQYIGSLSKPDAHPYVYKSRSKAAKACRKAGFRGLCAKSQIEGYSQCAAGWLSDSKGYWMDRTVKGCGKGRGFRGWGKGKVGAYCCAPTANNIEYIGDLKDTKAHPYVYKTRKAAKKACKAAGYHGLCSKSQGSGFHKCKAGWYSDYKGYWMSEGKKGCGKGRGWRKWSSKHKAGAYCCNLASNSKWIGSLTNPKKKYVYKKKKAAAKACNKAGYDRLCRKFEIEGYAKCKAGWMEDFKGYWFDRTKRGCGKKKGYRGWGKKDKAGAYCCSPKDNVKYIGNLKKPKKHPYVYKTRSKAEAACKTAGYRRLCYKSEIEFHSKCAAGWLKDYKGYWFKKTKKGCGSGTGYRGWGKGKVGAYCCEKLTLPLCHEDQLASSKGVWRCDDYSGSTGDEANCVEKYQQIQAEGKVMHFKCVASDAGGGKFNCLAGDKCQPIFPRGTTV
eukprot:s77_g11.t3